MKILFVMIVVSLLLYGCSGGDNTPFSVIEDTPEKVIEKEVVLDNVDFDNSYFE